MSTLGESMCKGIAKPFLKWAGGKGQLLNTFDKMFPEELEQGEIETYIEPFAGGGAVLFHILQNYNIKKAYINDINKELINCYRCIKENVNEVILVLEKLEQEYLNASDRNEYFYVVRDRYNEIKLNGHLDFEKCADFIFLNRTCFNGLYRVNKAGKFNVPHGKYKNPLICDKDNLELCSNLLQKVEISYGNYNQVLTNADNKTFVYFDPPYRPLIDNASFTSYDKSGFNDDDQKELARQYKELDKKGSKTMLSNSDPKNENENDNFFDDLYKGFEIERVYAKRMINCQATKRGDITEIVVMNYKRRKYMIINGKGGGNTRTGLVFEGKTDLATFLNSKTSYEVKGNEVYFNNEKVARVFKKHAFYKIFLQELNIDWKKYISKQLLPDDCIFVLLNNTLFIIECKFQQVAGSVDEKLQTCDFKRKQYQKLMSNANIDVEYIYLLSDWFRNPTYKDVLDYIISVNCSYYFEYIPLTKLGLPVPEDEQND